MRNRKFSGLSAVAGTVRVPGDKSIAHRSIILSALSRTRTRIRNFPANADCQSTVAAFTRLGIRIKRVPDTQGLPSIIVHGRGLSGLERPRQPVFAGESGTTFRLLLGVLAAQHFPSTLFAGPMLSRRPMARVTAPLRMMGARLSARTASHRKTGSKHEEYPPVKVFPSTLHAITYRLPVASAQVKSAILLAGLYARGLTRVIEPIRTRDHTERMLKAFKADIKVNGDTIVIRGGRQLAAVRTIVIPGDISSASFFIVLALLAKGSKLLIRDVSLNPCRIGILSVLKRMGAKIKVTGAPRHQVTGGEPMGDIEVKTSRLKATTVSEKEIPSLIDELPILMVAACCAEGRSRFKAVGELRVKETDRIASMTANLTRMGADITVTRSPGHHDTRREDVVIRGVPFLKGAKLKSFQDHRTAMSVIIAALCAKGSSSIDDVACISKSFPDFLKVLRSITPK